LIVAGILIAVAGYGFGNFFPIIKKIWTSSYMLVTSGWAYLVFAIIYWLIEIKGIKTGTKPWIIFGSNAIAVYVLADVFETLFIKTGIHDFAMITMQNLGFYIKNASLIWAVFSMFVCWTAGWILYRKKIFIKL
jgi:predicted acyltransferase